MMESIMIEVSYEPNDISTVSSLLYHRTILLTPSLSYANLIKQTGLLIVQIVSAVAMLFVKTVLYVLNQLILSIYS